MGGIIDTILPATLPLFHLADHLKHPWRKLLQRYSRAQLLVDAEGNPVDARDFYWSTGETGPTASNLCVNVPYYVSITGMDGCQLVGSFAIVDYTQPMDPIGYWTIYGFGSSYDLNYTAPGSGYVCNWVFSDGTTLTGENVKYALAGRQLRISHPERLGRPGEPGIQCRDILKPDHRGDRNETPVRDTLPESRS